MGQGTKVWLQDKKLVWAPGQVVSVHLVNEDEVRLSVEQQAGLAGQPLVLSVKRKEEFPPLKNPDLLLGANDLTTLSYLHEPAGRFEVCVCVCVCDVWMETVLCCSVVQSVCAV